MTPRFGDYHNIARGLHTCDRLYSAKVVGRQVCFKVVQNLLVTHYLKIGRINEPFLCAVNQSTPIEKGNRRKINLMCSVTL
jgi:hypothetical protein